MRRLANESFRAYKNRRNACAKQLKKKLAGVMVWASKVTGHGMTYKRGMALTKSRMTSKV